MLPDSYKKMALEGCHGLPLSRNNSGGTKYVMVKFENKKIL